MDTKVIRVVAHYTETLDVYVRVPAHVDEQDVLEHYKSVGANGEFEKQDASWDWDYAEEVDEDVPLQKVWPMFSSFPTPEFPYEEIRDKDGDYFRTVDQAKEAGFSEDQIWSVTEESDEDEEGQERTTFCYGPYYHYVNLIGYVATKEPRMSDDEYYYETWTMDD